MCIRSYDVDREILTAIIGVGSTLLGTILGWLLNNFSNRGKLRIHYQSTSTHLRHNFDTQQKAE